MVALQKGNNMKLKEWIKEEGLSCSEAARRFGIMNINPATNVWSYCNGQRIPRPKEMIKIYKATNKKVQPNDFYDL